MSTIDNIYQIESFNDNEEIFAWYTLRVLSVNEEKVLFHIKEQVKHYNLSEKIVDVQILKEYKIVESQEFQPNSSELPLRATKNAAKSVWIKTPYGKIKKITLVEVRPFKGLIFIKTVYNADMFKTIKSWDTSTYFLGDPIPHSMTETSFMKMKNSLNSTPPSLQDYVKEKGYTLLTGTLRHSTNIPFITKSTPDKYQDDQDLVDDVAPIQKAEQPKVDTPEVPEQQSLYDMSVGKKSIKDITKLKVNDFVYVNDFGSQGCIQNINLETGEIIVSIQAFGRRQPIVCNISQLSEI